MTPYSSHLRDDSFAIFLFHGVVRQHHHPLRNYTRKHLALDKFVEIVCDLRSHGEPISMDDVVAANARGRVLPKRAFVVTFDDGFENNYLIAAPVLREFNVPAMFYITTGFIESNSLSWIDMIEYAVEKMERVEVTLPFTNKRAVCQTLEEKMHLLDQIRQFVKSNLTIDPYEFAYDVCHQCGVETIVPDPELDQKMRPEQLRALYDSPLFVVGGHSHTHRIMSYLPLLELQIEVETSMRKLREWVGQPLTHYSYPEGLAHCYSDQVIAELRKNGIVCSPTAEYGVNKVGDDLFRLKRIMVV
jgi:peptidoglycan/xylan/chitin deacetylase (PgdA/CDA1 family)